MPGTELATAYLTLIPSLRGAKKQIESQLGGVDTTAAAKKIGSGLGQGIGGLEDLPDAPFAEAFLSGQMPHGGAAGGPAGGMAAELPHKTDALHGGQQVAAARHIDDRSAEVAR